MVTTCTVVGIHRQYTTAAIAVRKNGSNERGRQLYDAAAVFVFYHLRPRGVLSACALLAFGNDLEGTSIFFVEHAVFITFIQYSTGT